MTGHVRNSKRVSPATQLYYSLRWFVPRRLQIALRRAHIRMMRGKYENTWPINASAASRPRSWTGWPDDKKFAVVLTHDVEFQRGHDRCKRLADLEEELGFRSSFNFVPERYNVSDELIRELSSRGFEIGVHGLTHDGRLYQSWKIFQERAVRINHYLKKWNACGFRSPSMHHNLEWLHELDIEYDASTFDTDPFEPQPGGIGRIFPLWIPETRADKGYVELPYTIPQDMTTFVLLKHPNIDIWKQKLEWICEQGGMALNIVHPDYMNFGAARRLVDEYPARHYSDYLEYVKTEHEGQYWHALPREVARFWTATQKEQSQP